MPALEHIMLDSPIYAIRTWPGGVSSHSNTRPNLRVWDGALGEGLFLVRGARGFRLVEDRRRPISGS